MNSIFKVCFLGKHSQGGIQHKAKMEFMAVWRKQPSHNMYVCMKPQSDNTQQTAFNSTQLQNPQTLLVWSEAVNNISPHQYDGLKNSS